MQIDADKFEKDGKEEKFDKIRKERGYDYEDKVVINQDFPDYENTVSCIGLVRKISDCAFILDGSTIDSDYKFDTN